MAGIARNPQYNVQVIDLSANNPNRLGGSLLFQNIGYIKVVRFQTSADLDDVSSVVLDGQINFSLGDIQRGNPIPLLYNNTVRFPQGAARLVLSWPAQSGTYAVVAYSSDPNEMDLDTPNPKQLVTSALGTTLTPTAVSVPNAATLLTAADTGRFSVAIQNLDAALNLFIGNAGVTVANGTRVLPGGTAILDKQTAAVYGIASAAGPIDVRVLVESA